jgi:superoxide dismutase
MRAGGRSSNTASGRSRFAAAAARDFGSVAAGAATGQLAALPIEKHQNHVLSGWVPILAIDVREHACDPKYQNRRVE